VLGAGLPVEDQQLVYIADDTRFLADNFEA